MNQKNSSNENKSNPPERDQTTIVFNRSWHERMIQIGKRENIDPDALEGFGVTYQLLMNLSPPVSELLQFFTLAGIASNKAGMKRFLARISNRNSVPRDGAKGKRLRVDPFVTKAIDLEESGAYSGWEKSPRRQHISKILFTDKFGVAWDQALEFWGDEETTTSRTRHKKQWPSIFHETERPKDFHDVLWSKVDDRLRKRQQRLPRLETVEVGQIIQNLVQLCERVNLKYPLAPEPTPSKETDKIKMRRHSNAIKTRAGAGRRTKRRHGRVGGS